MPHSVTYCLYKGSTVRNDLLLNNVRIKNCSGKLNLCALFILLIIFLKASLIKNYKFTLLRYQCSIFKITLTRWDKTTGIFFVTRNYWQSITCTITLQKQSSVLEAQSEALKTESGQGFKLLHRTRWVGIWFWDKLN